MLNENNKKINWYSLQTWELLDLLHEKQLQVDKPYLGEAIPDPAESYPQNKRGKCFRSCLFLRTTTILSWRKS